MSRASTSHVEADRPLAKRMGVRLRYERQRVGLTQAALAQGRYTKAYVSALENGLVKPSLAALNFFADRLGIAATRLLDDPAQTWSRLDADIRLASGDWQAAIDAYEALLPSATRRTRPEILRGLAEAYCRLERSAEAVRAASEAAAGFSADGRTLEESWANYWESFGLYQLEQSDEARRLLVAIDDRLLAASMVDPDLKVRTAIARANVESRDDQPERALALLEAARSAADELDDRRRATFLFSLAAAYHEMGDLEAAIVTGQRSLAHFQAASSVLEEASLENELALVYLALDRTDAARTHAASARTLFERMDNRRWLAHVTETEAQIALADGDAPTAAGLARDAASLAREAGNLKAEISALISLARARQEMGDVAAAREALEQAARHARAAGRRGQLQLVLRELAQVVAEQGELRLAFELSQEALSVDRVATRRARPAASTTGNQARTS